MLGDDIAVFLPQAREQAESLMVDACVVERRSGRVLDESTLQYADTWAEVYVGRCRVQVVNVQPAEPVVGGRAWNVTQGVVQLPVGSVEFADDDRVTVTASVFEPLLVGCVFTVLSREVKSHATMRRLRVAEVRS